MTEPPSSPLKILTACFLTITFLYSKSRKERRGKEVHRKRKGKGGTQEKEGEGKREMGRKVPPFFVSRGTWLQITVFLPSVFINEICSSFYLNNR